MRRRVKVVDVFLFGRIPEYGLVKCGHSIGNEQ